MASIDVLNLEKYNKDASLSVFGYLANAAKMKSSDWCGESFRMENETFANVNNSNILVEIDDKETSDEDGQDNSWDCAKNFDSDMLKNGASDFRHRIKSDSYSNQYYLGTVGLKYLSCGIPKKSRSHRGRKGTEKKPGDSQKRISETSLNPVRHRRNSQESSREYKIENTEFSRSKKRSGNNVKGSKCDSTYNSNENDSRDYANAQADFAIWCEVRKNEFSTQKQNDASSHQNVLVQTQQRLNLIEKRAEDFSYDNSYNNEQVSAKQCSYIPDKRTRDSSYDNSMQMSPTKISQQVLQHTKVTEEKNLQKPVTSHTEMKLCKKIPAKNEISNISKPEECENKMLCITVNVKGEKCYETITELRTFQWVKKKFPKFAEVIPEVNGNENQLQFSADAVKTVLGFLFNQSCNFNSVRNEITAVEVLALTYSWEVTKFQKLYQKHLLENVLSEKNATKMFSLATHFSLQDIKEACLLLKNNIKLVTYKQRKCSVTVFTYVDPLEFSIPLQPAGQQLSESFDRSIKNEIEFESFSECYTITGFQIQLIVDDSAVSSSSKLTIFYSVENTTENLVVPEQKIQKHLGSTIILYFNKKLLIKPKQKGKISVYTDLKPCVCYAFENSVIENDKFRLTLMSNYKVQKTDRKVFFIGKLFYHVKCPEG